MTVKGVDVSMWQEAIDWPKLKGNGFRFAYIKASEALYQDEYFVANWKNAKAAGVARGAYHYLRPADPEGQAVHFARLLEGDRGELTPAVDFERYSAPVPSLSALGKFCLHLEQLTGVIPVIYTNNDTWHVLGNDYAWWSRFPLWIASWDRQTPQIPRPWKNYYVWQYGVSPDGKTLGVSSGGLDLDTGEFEIVPPAPAPAEPSDAEKLARLWAAHPELHQEKS